MGITVKIYDIRRQFGGITEPRARSALLSHAHRCNTSLDTMLVSVYSLLIALSLRVYLLHQTSILNDLRVYSLR
jgi:hypothetical protein